MRRSSPSRRLYSPLDDEVLGLPVPHSALHHEGHPHLDLGPDALPDPGERDHLDAAVRVLQEQLASYVPGVGEVTVFCGAFVGAGLGFLWFNAYPAQVFMGDVGSLSIGGTLGFLAVLCKQELLLVLLGAVFVVETLSVIVQVGYFKASGGNRFFRMAPLHHHFELKGIPESKIIVRCWILSFLCAVLALASLKLR